MAFPEGIWILALTSLVVSALGWKKFLYFISLGYGFSIAAMGLALVVMYRAALAPHTLLLALLLVAYGCRLGGFLLHRSCVARRTARSCRRSQKRLMKWVWE